MSWSSATSTGAAATANEPKIYLYWSWEVSPKKETAQRINGVLRAHRKLGAHMKKK